MSEPVMYPSTDYPTHQQEFDDFAELRAAVERTDEGLNAIVSWHLYTPTIPEDFEDFREYEPHESPEFVLLVFMPRKSATTQFGTNRFVRDEVETWLGGYVRERVMRWYGWAQ